MKTTLVAVSGLSPAIITETIWALAQESPPVIPQDVIIVTTEKGERDIEEQLLDERQDWSGKSVWSSLRSSIFDQHSNASTTDLQLSIRVVELPDPETGVKTKATDLRSAADCDVMADYLIQTLSPLVDAVDNRVIASIAGGRKTMGALVYGTMNLIGKAGDRVTHVLVNEPFENCRDFYYPDQPVQLVSSFRHPEQTFRAADAVIELSDLLFVPLRNRFAELNEPRRSFRGLVDYYALSPSSELARPPVVSLTIDTGAFVVEGRKMALVGRKLVVAAFLYQRALAGEPHFAGSAEAKEAFLDYYRKWKQEQVEHPATQRLPPAPRPDSIEETEFTLFTQGLSEIRKTLQDYQLDAVIPFLAPPNARVGFEMRSPE